MVTKGLILYLQEGKNLRKWDESGAEIVSWADESFQSGEQEFTAMDVKDDETVLLDCSYTSWLVKLARNPSLKVFRMTVNPSGRILAVRARAPKRVLSIRS